MAERAADRSAGWRALVSAKKHLFWRITIHFGNITTPNTLEVLDYISLISNNECFRQEFVIKAVKILSNKRPLYPEPYAISPPNS